MGRPQRSQDIRGGTAGRLAASRRGAWKERDSAARAQRGTSTRRRGAPQQPSSGARLLKLGLLALAFAVIGFFAVLVMDASSSALARAKVGDSSISTLWEKLVDRFLDRDVPRPQLPAPRPRARPAPSAPEREAARAPLPATRPEDDRVHVDVRPDPHVEDARRRLDALLERL